MPLVGLSFGPAAVAFLDGMQPGKIRAQLAKSARALIENPYPSGCKKLDGIAVGTDAVWRVIAGDYRILYVARPMEIIVLDISNRKDVYG